MHVTQVRTGEQLLQFLTQNIRAIKRQGEPAGQKQNALSDTVFAMLCA